MLCKLSTLKQKLPKSLKIKQIFVFSKDMLNWKRCVLPAQQYITYSNRKQWITSNNFLLLGLIHNTKSVWLAILNLNIFISESFFW